MEQADDDAHENDDERERRRRRKSDGTHAGTCLRSAPRIPARGVAFPTLSATLQVRISRLRRMTFVID
jgi:hypothetical protein